MPTAPVSFDLALRTIGQPGLNNSYDTMWTWGQMRTSVYAEGPYYSGSPYNYSHHYEYVPDFHPSPMSAVEDTKRLFRSTVNYGCRGSSLTEYDEYGDPTAQYFYIGPNGNLDYYDRPVMLDDSVWDGSQTVTAAPESYDGSTANGQTIGTTPELLDTITTITLA